MIEGANEVKEGRGREDNKTQVGHPLSSFVPSPD